MIFRLFSLALYGFLYIQGCISAVSNRTIDDINGDTVTGLIPSYGPPDAPWNAVVNNNCTGCRLQPDASQTVDLTWHDVTVDDGATTTVSIQFTGTAIYFFGIVPNTVTGDPIIQVVNVTFSLDGASTGSYTHIPDSTTTILYHVPMLAVDNLSNSAHILIANAQSSSWFFFDYAMYTFDDGNAVTTSVGTSSTSGLMTTNTVPVTTTASTIGQDNSNQTVGASAASSKSHSSTGAVVGSVCGALAILLAGTLIWCSRRRRRYRKVPHLQPDAFVVDPTPYTTQVSDPTPYTREVSSSIAETREVSRLQSSAQ